ncbi:MAG: M23 family metallopeptidase, partial [Candidatus Caenarcaniphilales bacterium]|nr:M23 family metallopeptidase [Candidatus Caenarcaniphilales bacterium]
GPDPKVLGRLEREVKDKINMTEFSKYLTDKETGLSWYAGMLSPISLEKDPNLSLGASEGSRFFENEGFYRSHDGMDFAAPGGTQTVSTINGTVKQEAGSGTVTITTDDGKYRVRYLHMPPGSFVDVGHDGRTSVGDDLGKVGGWGLRDGKWKNDAYAPHLHYEVLENRPVLVKTDQGFEMRPRYVPIDPRSVDLSKYQTK